MIFHNLTIDRVKQEQKERIQKSSTKIKIEYKNRVYTHIFATFKTNTVVLFLAFPNVWVILYTEVQIETCLILSLSILY